MNLESIIRQQEISSFDILQYLQNLFYINCEYGITYTNICNSVGNNIQEPVEFITVNFLRIIPNNIAHNGSFIFEFDRHYYPVSTYVKSSVLNSLLKTGL